MESWLKLTILLLTHFVPLTSCCVLAALNLRGYFVGEKITLGLDETTEATAILGLQLAAKLLVGPLSIGWTWSLTKFCNQELMIIASLGVMIHDFLGYLLLYDEGLPLPLTGIKFSFTDLRFFLTSSFRNGVRVLRSRMDAGSSDQPQHFYLYLQ